MNFAIEILSRVLLILLFYSLAQNHGAAFLAYGKISSLLYVALEALLILSVVFRKPALRFSASPFDWLIALIATLLPLTIFATTDPDHTVFLALQCVGILVTIAGLLSLNRSFGLVAAERDIKTGGIYRIIRHPLYAGYTLSNIAILLNHYHTQNLILVALAIVTQIIRLIREEKFLQTNPQYAQFMQRTRWRLLPYLW